MTTKITSLVLGNQSVNTVHIAAQAVGSTQIADGAILQNHYAALSIPTTAVKDSAVTTAKIGDRQVTSIKIATGGIIAEHYANGSISTIALADASISTPKYIDRSVTGTKIALTGIITENLADSSVTGPKLANASLLATHFVNNIIDPSRLVNGTAGDFIVGGTGGVFGYLNKGTEGSVMAIKNGSPTWTSSILTTGMLTEYLGLTAPPGWVMGNGRTIGNASSGATERANTDCQALFIFLWNNFPNSILAVSGGRGSTADVDWSANKNIALPDLRGRTSVGHDAMNNSSANRLTNATAAPNGTTLGATGGTETITLAESNIPVHTHVTSEYVSGNNTLPDITASTDVMAAHGGGGNIAYSLQRGPNGVPNTGITSSFGGGLPTRTISPFFVVAKIIKL